MTIHKIGDLLMFRDKYGKKTLGYIESTRKGAPYEGEVYKVLWFNQNMPDGEDISTERDYQVRDYKRNLEEYLRGIRD